MPGRTPAEAHQAFLRPLQQTISCITRQQVYASHGANRRRQPAGVLALSTTEGPVPFGHDPRFTLSVGMQYEIVRTDDPGRGPYKVATRGYDYGIRPEGSTRPIYAFHWHPQGQSDHKAPHIHASGHDPRAHIPSQRISLESVVRFCIEELGADPHREDWQSVLAINEDKFEVFRSWPPQPRLSATGP